MVKRSRRQSTDEPMRRICDEMLLPVLCFHSQTLAMKASRPMAWGEMPWASSCRSTTICVAICAWSVPVCHSARAPFMRW